VKRIRSFTFTFQLWTHSHKASSRSCWCVYFQVTSFSTISTLRLHPPLHHHSTLNSRTYHISMADAGNGDEPPSFVVPEGLADKLDELQLGLFMDREGRIFVRHREATTTPTLLGSTVYAVATYITIAIVASYLIIQFMEAISFIINPNTGITEKAVWVVFISVCGLAAAIFCASAVEDRAAPPQLPRWMLDRLW
jgi:hypothetical protein